MLKHSISSLCEYIPTLGNIGPKLASVRVCYIGIASCHIDGITRCRAGIIYAPLRGSKGEGSNGRRSSGKGLLMQSIYDLLP